MGRPPALTPRSNAARLWLVALPACVFASGAAGLTYELTWIRLFSVLYGNSTYAIAVVVALFLGGLALGAYLFGKRADRTGRPLVLYAGIEIGIAVTAVPVPALLRWLEPVVAGLYGAGRPPLGTLTAVRTLLALICLIVPTTLMGATLPVATRALVTRGAEVGERVGLLYGLNTLGAVFGCLLTGFVLIHRLGSTRATYVATAANLAVAAALLLLSRKRLPAVEGGRRPGGRPQSLRGGRALPRTVLVSLFVSGFAALAYEVVWARVLGFVFQRGMSVHSFTVLLAVMLGGLGIGGLLYARIASSLRSAVGTLGLLHILVGASAILSLLVLSGMGPLRTSGGSVQVWTNDVLTGAVLMLVPTVLMGVAFPLACRLVARHGRVGAAIGTAYGVNTAGSVTGPLVASFLLVPRIGSEGTLKLMVAVNVVMGVVLMAAFARGRNPALRRLRRIGYAFLVVALVGVVRDGYVLGLVNPRSEPVASFREDETGTLLATRQRHGINLVVGGSTGAGSLPRYQRTDELLAYIPLLLHPSPRRVAVVGFGTGRTTGLYAYHPSVESVDTVEIARAAFAAGRGVFSSFNQDVLDHPKVNPILDDGFNFVKYAQARYDVVSLDPFAPRDPGSARMYTRDFLELTKARLRPGGMVVMWTYPAWVRTTSFRIALKTFHDVFPETTVWLSPGRDFLLFLATPGPLRIDAAQLEERLGARPSPGRFPYHLKDPDDFLRCFFLDSGAVRRISNAEPEPIFTVDRPNLEYVYALDRSPRLNARWRSRVASSVLPLLDNAPPELMKALTPRRRGGRR